MIGNLSTVDRVKIGFVLSHSVLDTGTDTAFNGVVPVNRTVKYVLCRSDKVGIVFTDKSIGKSGSGLNRFEQVCPLIG